MATFSSDENEGLRNTFQIMLVDSSGANNDDVDIIVNYGSMRNELDEGYCDEEGDELCNHVAIGLGNVSGDVTIYNSIVDDSGVVLNGKLTNELWDEGEFALNTLHLNSTIPGRFVFQMHDGELPGSTIDAGPGCTDPEAANYNSLVTDDDGSCKYGVIDLSATAGNGELNLSWGTPISGDLEDHLSYTILYSPGNGEITEVDKNATGYTLSGLTNGTTYTIQVCALYDLDEVLSVCKSTTKAPVGVSTSKPGYG